MKKRKKKITTLHLALQLIKLPCIPREYTSAGPNWSPVGTKEAKKGYQVKQMM